MTDRAEFECEQEINRQLEEARTGRRTYRIDHLASNKVILRRGTELCAGYSFSRRCPGCQDILQPGDMVVCDANLTVGHSQCLVEHRIEPRPPKRLRGSAALNVPTAPRIIERWQKAAVEQE